jgi:DNA polymerase-3 subunit alpha
MKAYMERSLGLLVYQDDVLMTAINIAGYNWEEADKFRKAMGKKIPEEMVKQEAHFLEGAVQNGMTHEKAVELFNLIKPFAAYGFNKAHAASYAMITYQTAYMKANFPVEFMAAVMTAEYGDTEKIAHAMEECKKMGIAVLPPDVNKSRVAFTIEDLSAISTEELQKHVGDIKHLKHKQAIRFGMSAIKNVGISAIESILEARAKGEFVSMMDLCGRADNRLVNRKTLEALIKAGAMDNLGKRSAQLQVLDQCIDRARKYNKAAQAKQASLFGDEEVEQDVSLELPDIEELATEQMLEFEKELLGFYLHEPTFVKLLHQMGDDFCTHKPSQITEDVAGQRIVLGGVISAVKKVITKKSAAEMAFLQVTDTLSTLEIVVFPTTFAKVKHLLTPDTVVLIQGKIDKREDALSMIADEISLFDPNTSAVVEKTIEIDVPRGTDAQVLQKINRTLREYPGRAKVAIVIANANSLKRMDLPYGVKIDPLLFETVEDLLGKGTVRLT